jgi:CTD small phosphatase-like protein 2
VFDLDETLIHCNESVNMPCDVRLTIKLTCGQSVEAGINIRPYAIELLKQLSRQTEIITFTASHSCYANVVLDCLDPHKQYISHRLFREHCFLTSEGVYIKDLRVIDRELEDMVLVDNAAYSYSLQVENGIPIFPYYRGKVDYELKALQSYLQGLLMAKDVRDCNRDTFKLNKYTQFEDPDTLFKTLYAS